MLTKQEEELVRKLDGFVMRTLAISTDKQRLHLDSSCTDTEVEGLSGMMTS